MPRKTVPYRVGDLFSIPLPDGTFATARILLDVNTQCFKPGRIKGFSHLRFFDGSLLVEIYGHITTEPSGLVSDVVIPSVFISPSELVTRSKDRWKITGHVDVDPTRVTFPEGLMNGLQELANFVTGEISYDTDIPVKKIDYYQARPSLINSARIVPVCCYYLGRKDLLGEQAEAFTMRSSDLRFTEHREEIYRILDWDPNRSYYEMAKSWGFDLARFYE